MKVRQWVWQAPLSTPSMYTGDFVAQKWEEKVRGTCSQLWDGSECAALIAAVQMGGRATRYFSTRTVPLKALSGCFHMKFNTLVQHHWEILSFRLNAKLQRKRRDAWGVCEAVKIVQNLQLFIMENKFKYSASFVNTVCVSMACCNFQIKCKCGTLYIEKNPLIRIIH